MRSDWVPLAPIFRSVLQGRLLALVLLDPDHEWSISDLASRLDAPLTSVQTEVSRLVTSDVFSDRKLGRTRLVRANSKHPGFEALSHLALLSFGPQWVVAQEFEGLGADAVYIFGSWAARFHGSPGGIPADIDVLVVGDGVDRHEMFEASRRASETLGFEVNPVTRNREQWQQAAQDPLLADVTTKPMVLAWGEEP